MAPSRLDMTRMFISSNVFCSIYYTGEKVGLFYIIPIVIFPVIAAILSIQRNWTLNKVVIHEVSRVTIRNEIGYLFFVNIILGLIFQTYAFLFGTLAVYIPEIIQFLRMRIHLLRMRIHQSHTPR